MRKIADTAFQQCGAEEISIHAAEIPDVRFFKKPQNQRARRIHNHMPPGMSAILISASPKAHGLWNGRCSKFIPKKPVRKVNGIKIVAIAVKRFITLFPLPEKAPATSQMKAREREASRN